MEPLSYVSGVIEARLVQMGFSPNQLDRATVESRFRVKTADPSARFYEVELSGSPVLLGIWAISAPVEARQEAVKQEISALRQAGRAVAGHSHKNLSPHEGVIMLTAIAPPDRSAATFDLRINQFVESFMDDEVVMSLGNPNRGGPLLKHREDQHG